GLDIGALHGVLQLVDGGLHSGLVVGVDLVLGVLQSLLGLVDHLVGLVAHINLFLALGVLGGKLLGLLDGLVDVLLGHIGGGGDGDVLLLAGAQILGGHVHDAVGVDVEGNLDLRHAAAGGSNAVQVEAAQ